MAGNLPEPGCLADANADSLSTDYSVSVDLVDPWVLVFNDGALDGENSSHPPAHTIQGSEVPPEGSNHNVEQVHPLAEGPQDLLTHSTHSTSHVEEEFDIIRHLKLEKFYPEKISLSDVMQVGESRGERETQLENVPWIILQKLVMLNREAVTSEIKKCTKVDPDSLQGDDSGSDSSLDFSELCTNDHHLHPSDVFLAIFVCCDLSLRQILVEKMNQCRLAFPFLFPDQYKQNLNLSLWALRSTQLAWRNVLQEAIEASAVNYPLNVVGSVRLGRPEFSKSKVLSNIINDQVPHTFLNKDSPNGNIKQDFSEGLVEGTFYLPSGKDTDSFKDVTMFLNLRGDGLTHKNQVSILSQLSNVVTVGVDISDLQQRIVQDQMKQIHQHCRKVVMILSNKKFLLSDQVKGLLKEYKKQVGQSFAMVLSFTGNDNKNEAHLKDDTQEQIANSLVGEIGVKLQHQQQMMRNHNVYIDEMNHHCQKGKEFADRVTACLDEINGCISKPDLLPLQEKYWKEWCSLLKQKRRSKQPTGQPTELDAVGKMESQMQDCRKEQDNLCANLNPLMKNFIDGLMSLVDSPSIVFYMQWIKMHLNELSSQTLPPLLREYQVKVKGLEDDAKAQAASAMTLEELRYLEQKIENATFGIEHLMREMGQIYEAAFGTGNMEHFQNYQILPNIAATLCLKGYALEIMDGNASGVPRTWLQAVFAELQRKLQNQKLFTLSVLGLQSSGKSTLLNTMFGLQFPVSAGRCTRGVYMQLLKVKAESNLPFSYVAILDSEGLRAPEIGESNFDHDNELATFLIGLGNLTIINLKGENVAEAKDILQIVCHAFLRMMMVNPNIQKKRACVFVHQNVPAFDAKEKMQVGSQKFKEALDQTTAEAAKLENIAEIRRFNQVIKFDSQRHIWYFPDLWHGTPPMAAVNLEYHKKVMELASALLQHKAADNNWLLSPTELMTFISDMWDGVLADDFVFGFRNSAVTKAYNLLEEKYSELRWILEKAILTWLDKVENQVKKLVTKRDVQQKCEELKREAISTIKEQTELALLQLDEFIENSSQKALIYQWKNDKKVSLKYATHSLVLKTEKYIDEMSTRTAFDIQKDSHKNEILLKAKKLEEEMKKRGFTDKGLLDSEFDKMWTEWIDQISHHEQKADTPISVTLQSTLYDVFPQYRNMIEKEISNNPLDGRSWKNSLQGSFTAAQIQKGDLSYKNFTSSVRSKLSSSWKEDQKDIAVNIVNRMFHNADSYLNNLSKRSSCFQEHYAQEVLKIVQTGVREVNENPDVLFSMPTQFEIRLAVHVASYALSVFCGMEHHYDVNYSMAAQLKAYRKTTWNLFQNLVQGKSDEKIIADMICDEIEQLMISLVSKRLETAVVNELLPQFVTKANLMRTMLKDLAEKANFENYETYIYSPKTFAMNWLANYMDQFVFAVHDSEPSWYIVHAEGAVNEVNVQVKQSINKASELLQGQQSTSLWVQHFTKEVSSFIPYTGSSASRINEYRIQDFENLNVYFDRSLQTVRENVMHHFSSHTMQNMKWIDRSPHEQVLEALWGCEAQCPFCKEPCMKSDPNHASQSDCHQCIQHRVQGVASWHGSRTQKLVVEDCNYSVQSNGTFGCYSTNHACEEEHEEGISHYFKDYKRYFTTWDIPKSSDMSSSDYWKWYLERFKAAIVKKHKYALPDIPKSWKMITKQKAIESLSLYI